MSDRKESIVKKCIQVCKKNFWMSLSIMLVTALIIVAFVPFGNVSKTIAAKNVIAFAELQGISAELVSVEENDGFYDVNLSIDGNSVPVKVTMDGKYLAQVTPLQITGSAVSSGDSASADVPKSDKPIVELFVWSYCPYGVQAQGPLAEVALLLENSADISTVLYYDGHGPFETEQNKIQACIQEVAKDKYWDYAAAFVKDIYPKCGSTGEIICDKTESVKLMKLLGIDDSKIMSCVDERGDSLFAEASSLAQQYGVTGSPTLMINGVKVNSERTPEAFKTAICEAFINAPSECSEVLDSNGASTTGTC